jgi:hypothetical protein
MSTSLTETGNNYATAVIRRRVVGWFEGDPAWVVAGRISFKYKHGPYPRGADRVVALTEPDWAHAISF